MVFRQATGSRLVGLGLLLLEIEHELTGIGRMGGVQTVIAALASALDVSADIFDLWSKSLTLATPTSFTTRPIMQACWLSLLHRFGRMSKLFCSRLLAIFCVGNVGGISRAY